MGSNIEDIVDLLTRASNAYYNGKSPIMDDESYDALIDTLKEREPEHPFLKQVGSLPTSSVHHLPVIMRSLDKIKPGEQRLNRFLTSATNYLMSEKLDGLSALWIPSKRQLFLRGNGIEGCLLSSEMIQHIKGLVQSSHHWIVRGELIMKRSTELINGRSIVNGILHHKTPDTSILSKVEFIAYEVHTPTGLIRSEQFKWLEDNGFSVPWWTKVKNPSEQICTQAFIDRRKNSLYDTDGIVIGVDQAPIYSPTPMKGPVQNPKDCVAFKMAVTDQSATTTVKDVIWTPSAQGYLIPRIKFEPVLIGGASIEYCSGHNARTIVDKVLGPGAVIQIRRSGDVIPTLDSVSIPALIASLPSPTIGWQWNGSPEAATHICLTSVTSEQRVSQLHHFAKTLEIQGLGPASCKALVDAGIDSPKGLWESTESKLSKTLGPKTGKTLYDALRSLPTNDKITEITLLLASNKIPRGTGEAKLNSVFKMVPDLRNLIQLTTIPSGWTEETFVEFQYSLSDYEEWRKTEVYWIPYPILNKTVKAGPVRGIVCFTGFRDKDLEESLKKAGYTVSPTMTSTVTILVTPDDLSKESEKVKKARASTTVKVLTRTELLNNYL